MAVVNSVIIRPPVSIQDVRQVLGNSSTDLATLCMAGQINKWARYKPVRHSGVGVITEVQRKNVNYGINNIPVWTGNGAVNKMGNFWFGVDASSTNYPQCGLQTDYWSYLRPIGGANSPYRLADFVKEAGSTYGYKHDVVAPIGGCTLSSIKISATGYITIPFSGNGSGQTDGYTVPLGELSGVGVATGDFYNLYMSVMIRKVGTSQYYVCSRPDKWSTDMSTSVTGTLTVTQSNALEGSCEVFPFLSQTKFESFTNNLSGVSTPVVAMFEKSAVTVYIEKAKGEIGGFAAYYINRSDKYLNYVMTLTNNTVTGGFRAAYTIEFSSKSTFPSSDTVTASGNIYLAYGERGSIDSSITLSSLTAAHYANGYARVTVQPQAGYGILFYEQTSAASSITQGLPK